MRYLIVFLLALPLMTGCGAGHMPTKYDPEKEEDTKAAYQIQYGAFRVKAGNVIYPGHLFIYGEGKLPFNLSHKTEEVNIFLDKSGHTNLANRLKTTTFYQGGSVLLIEGDKYKLLSREHIEEIKNEVLKGQ